MCRQAREELQLQILGLRKSHDCVGILYIATQFPGKHKVKDPEMTVK